MRDKILKQAQAYALRQENRALKQGLRLEEMRVKSPLLFVLLGESSKEGIKRLQEEMSSRILNAEGIRYLYVSLGQQQEKADPTTLNLDLPYGDTQIGRSQLTDALFKSEGALGQLNLKLSQLRSQVLEQGNLFASWEQIYISIITYAKDPINVLLPDLTVLLSKKLEQDFKQVFCELFVIVEETGKEVSSLEESRSLSFLEELETYQKPEYSYHRPIELLDEKLPIDVQHDGELFRQCFILTDKRENGQKLEGASYKHYEAISSYEVIRNRQQKNLELVELGQPFNSNEFIGNVRQAGESRYATLSLAKVKKPGEGIYLASAYYLFKLYQAEFYGKGEPELDKLLEKVGLSERQLEQLLRECLPAEENLEELLSLITNEVNYKTLKVMTFSEAISQLYGETAEEFFEANFREGAKRSLESTLSIKVLKEKVYREIINSNQYGPYTLDLLCQEAIEGRLNQTLEHYTYELKGLENQLREAESKLVGEVAGGSFGLFDKRYLKIIKEYLIHNLYQVKYKILGIKLKLEAVELMRERLNEINRELKAELKKFEECLELLKRLMEEKNRYEEAYLVQNVTDYYRRMIEEEAELLRKVKGEHFLLEERFMGDLSGLLGKSQEALLERLFKVLEGYFLSDSTRFDADFEAELLARANMVIRYDDKEVAAKSELYHMLYMSLEENSKPCVYLDTTTSQHRYEEKYFMGDEGSEFIAYAYNKDEGFRNYKLGLIRDQRKSGLEKLQLMGGFKLSDLMFTKTARRYYEAYLEKGYLFHSTYKVGEDVQKQEGGKADGQ